VIAMPALDRPPVWFLCVLALVAVLAWLLVTP
jgi:hypothetical protein